METLIVFSHLRWNFVYQRPQHLLSRLAKKYRVIFFEEPVPGHQEAFVEITHPLPGLQVWRPHTPSVAVGFHDEQLPYLQPLLSNLLRDLHLTDYALWFYTPMALPLAQALTPQAIIYDCMDELSAFLNAPRQLLQRETALLKMADLVFTGGPSLYEAKKDRSEQVFCFPSSVDAEHFSIGKSAQNEADEQKSLPYPRLGFFGVIDERIDMELLEAVALRKPEWQLVLVGPIVKIDPHTLPRQPNVHYFGQQEYARLPQFLAGWDLCLLPFARNASTRFISPTKTLEYMAAERPIVSTPITDVVEPYGDIVYVGDTAEKFIQACSEALRATDAERQHRIEKMRTVLASTSWDATVAEMDDLIARTLSACAERRLSEPGALPASDFFKTAKTPPGREAVPLIAAEKYNGTYDIIAGAGPTGLSAAYHLGSSALLLEQNDRVGGWCRSIQENGFTFDHAGHIMFTNDTYVQGMYEMLLGDNVHWQEREAWIYSKEVYTRYPFQGALYGLPPKVIEECILGAVEARYGSVNSQAVPAAVSGKNRAPTVTDCCADGVAESTLSVRTGAGKPVHRTPKNFEEFIYQVWGAGIAKHFAIPYNRKLWAVPLDQMETSWLGGRVPQPDLAEIIEGALQPSPKPMGPNARFGYPLRGGFQALMDGFLPYLQGRLRLSTRITRVSPGRKTITLASGEVLAYRTLVSTMPLPVLVGLTGDEAPAAIQQAARSLRNVSVRCVNLGVAREHLTDKHWIYYPEDTVFHRIFVQGNASPHCNAPGGFGFTCEITYSPHKPLPCDGDALIQRCIDDCIRVGMIDSGDRILVANQVDMPYAYVVYDHERQHNVDVIRRWLSTYDILLAGRYSEWEYYNSDHAFLAGKKVAEEVRQRASDMETAKHVSTAPTSAQVVPLAAS